MDMTYDDKAPSSVGGVLMSSYDYMSLFVLIDVCAVLQICYHLKHSKTSIT